MQIFFWCLAGQPVGRGSSQGKHSPFLKFFIPYLVLHSRREPAFAAGPPPVFRFPADVRFAGDFLAFAGDFLAFAGDFLAFAGDFLAFAGDFLDFAGDFLAFAGDLGEERNFRKMGMLWTRRLFSA